MRRSAHGGQRWAAASRARASFALAERGAQQPRTLAAAFLKPVGPNDGSGEAFGDMAAASIARLHAFRDNVDKVYDLGVNESATFQATATRADGTLTDVVRFARECVG